MCCLQIQTQNTGIGNLTSFILNFPVELNWFSEMQLLVINIQKKNDCKTHISKRFYFTHRHDTLPVKYHRICF